MFGYHFRHYEKEIYFKPVQVNRRFVSNFETCYLNIKQDTISDILKILKEKDILKIKDNNNTNGKNQ